MSGAEHAYHDLLGRLWAAGEDFLLVEQDIGLHAQVIPTLTACPSVWCGYHYNMAGRVTAAFGCTRFRAQLLTAEPDLIHTAGLVDDGGAPPRSWQRLDVRVMSLLHARGWVRCEHTPPVTHYHRYP